MNIAFLTSFLMMENIELQEKICEIFGVTWSNA